MRVTIANFTKKYGTLADRALTEPITIMKNGRDCLVILSAEKYERLRRRDRHAALLKELTEAKVGVAEVDPIRASERGNTGLAALNR